MRLVAGLEMLRHGRALIGVEGVEAPGAGQRIGLVAN